MRNLQSQSSVNVIVREEMNKPPTARITGNVVITLPINTAELDGSKSSDDKGIVSYHWTRDEGSPAAGEVLNHSDHHPVLFLSNLVEGTYTFHLKVTDAKGESDTDRTTVEVKPDPRKNNLVEIILDVNVSQLTERLKGMFIRQIGVLLGVLDSDIIVQRFSRTRSRAPRWCFCSERACPPDLQRPSGGSDAQERAAEAEGRLPDIRSPGDQHRHVSAQLFRPWPLRLVHQALYL